MLKRFSIFAASSFAAGLAYGQAPEGVDITKLKYVEMSDGISIATTILKPEGEGPFPSVMVMSPYGDSVASPFFRPTPALLEAGYAVVVVDQRGTGCSGGINDIGTARFRRDGYELIEWIADQDWSTDKVGMGGPSARGIASWHVAAEKPPSLAAIAPQTFNANIYTGMTHMGGIKKYLAPLGWSLYSQPLQDMRVLRGADETCMENRRDHPRAQPLRALNILSYHHDTPQFQFESTDQWADDVEVPVLMFLSTYDRYTPAIGAWMFNDLKSPRRMLLANGGHGMSRMPDSQAEIVKWFDHWLKDENNGVGDTASSVTLYFETGRDLKPNYTRKFTSWPPEEIETLSFQLNADGRLISDRAETGSASYKTRDLPEILDFTPRTASVDFSEPWQAFGEVEDNGLVYRSDPFAVDYDVIGEIELDLTVSVDTFDTDLIAIASEEFADGSVLYVSRSGLRASHRAFDSDASAQAGRLIRKHDKSIPLTPDHAELIRMAFPPVVHRLQAGSRLRIDLVPAWVATAFLGWDWAVLPYEGIITIYAGEGQSSEVRVPVMPSAFGTPPAPACAERPNQPCRKAIESSESALEDVVDDL